jgi:hypothetical protein
VQNGIESANLRQLTIAAKSGVQDLSFIQTLHLWAYVPLAKPPAPPPTTDHQVEIADFQRRDHTAIGATFSVPLPAPVDLLPLLRITDAEQYRIVVVTNIGGEMPAAEWKLDVTMSLSFEIRQ